MPSIEKHIKLSLKRTGKPFRELHIWMEEEHKTLNTNNRHDIIQIPKNLEIVRKKFGDDAVNELLYHIKEDYENNKAYKIINILGRIKKKFL